MFQFQEISKRAEFGGFTGLRYGKKQQQNQFLKPQDYLHEPAFKEERIMNTMAKGDIETFKKETLERGRFLEQKHNLRGTQSVNEYEGTKQGAEDLVFDPLRAVTGQYAGGSSYDSGAHQGGEQVSAFLGSSVKTRDTTRGVSLEAPDPYAHAVSNKITINT